MAMPSSEILRFLLVGGVNTLWTLCLYWLMLPDLGYVAAYSISFVLGIVSGYTLNAFFVFRTRWSWRRLLAFPLVHAVNYVVGIGVIWIVVGLLGIDARLGPVVVVVATLPINFLLTRKLVAGGRRA